MIRSNARNVCNKRRHIEELRVLSLLPWYIDHLDDLRCDVIHHVGTSFYLYCAFKPSASKCQMENLKEKSYQGKATCADITRVTMRLGDAIAKVYGCKI